MLKELIAVNQTNQATVILKFICGWDRKIGCFEIVMINGTFSEAYLGPCQTSKIELFSKIVTGLRELKDAKSGKNTRDNFLSIR